MSGERSPMPNEKLPNGASAALHQARGVGSHMVPKLTKTRAKCPRLAYCNKAYDLIFSQLQRSLFRTTFDRLAAGAGFVRDSCRKITFITYALRKLCAEEGDERDEEEDEEEEWWWRAIRRRFTLKRNSMPAPVDICFHRCAHPM
ncbi:hypothetical protein EYF80_013766 [Liparis tanakae]|uniref:Uncharacterized protein n=1 Tax=Liparis tanakae TaxID=230148 RepID=A0A4Z2IFW8_9TELE|nr:hypothetical protein EYF80_013766 [Liparis tanakae]